MKILVSAFACDPYLGSENYFGWAAARALARDHELWIMIHSRTADNLKRATAEGLVPDNLHPVFVGSFTTWHPNRMRARFQNWGEYMEFSKEILPRARELHAEVRFDVVHHVTFATWRVASPLGQLGIPFVFGPVGGFEQFPLHLLPILSPVAGAFELARAGSNLASRCSPGVRRCIQSAAHVMAANPDTKQLVTALRGSARGVTELSPGFYTDLQIQNLSRFVPDKQVSGPLRVFAGGNLEGRKGVALALEALAAAKKQGVKFQYRLGGQGPELNHLKQLTSRLGLESDVIFGESLSGEAYYRELGNSHIFLLPSFRESCGLTMMEVMLAGGVPVVADCGGPSMIVTPECGFKIPVASRREMTRQLTETIIKLDRDRDALLAMGRAASSRIRAHFSEDNYRHAVNSAYLAVCRK